MVHLHVHNDGSLLDGKGQIEEYISRAKELGQTSIALTNHGNMVTLFNMYEKCKAEGIKLIIGCEFYVKVEDKRYHLVLLAKNKQGYENLLQLQYFSFMKNFHSKPQITYEELRNCREGLICLTACIGGELGKAILENAGEEFVYSIVNKLEEIFKSDLYLEIQPNSIPGQVIVNKEIVKISEYLHIPLVVTTDCHYARKEDSLSHDTLLCMSTKALKQAEKRFRFTGDSFYMMSSDEIFENLNYLNEYSIHEAINNTDLIANMCNVEIETNRNLLPKVSDNAKMELARLCNVGFKRRLEQGCFEGLDINKVVDRIKTELKDYTDKGYADYFLIVEDLIRYCEKESIPVGGGRGSVCGSEVAFILGITEVEPIRYGLLSERFLNPTRNSPPDIDSDFCYERREDVIQYIKNKYGEESICTIIAEGTLTTSAVVRKVLSAYGFDMAFIKNVGKWIPKRLGTKVSEAYNESEQFRNFLNNEPELRRDIFSLEGTISHFSKHACGVIIAPDKIYKYLPIMRDSDDHTMMCSQWNKKVIEKIGMYKFDILGLKLLTIFNKTIEQVKINRGIELKLKDLYHIGFEDNSIYEVLNSGDMCGVFQFDAPSGKETVMKAKPKVFEDIIACESICRPGVKEADLYLSNKKLFDEESAYPIPTYWNSIKHILEPTYGAIIYQEQTMLLISEIGGFTLGEADSLRKVKSLEPYRERFVTNAVYTLGLTTEEANELFDRFSLEYSFNKSHATIYGKNSAICCYLKHNFRAEFMASGMTLELTKAEPDTNAFIKECQKHGIKILPPDINKSTGEFIAIDSETILMPITAIAGLGDKTVQAIVNKRPYATVEAFRAILTGRECNATNIKKLVKAGCFDFESKNRALLLKQIDSKEQDVFWCDELKMRYERETIGISLSIHPLSDVHNAVFNELPNTKITLNCMISDFRTILDKNGKQMAFVKFENIYSDFEGVLFSYLYERLKTMLVPMMKVKLTGTKENSKIKIEMMEVL